jgi:hypothetical protein
MKKKWVMTCLAVVAFINIGQAQQRMTALIIQWPYLPVN